MNKLIAVVAVALAAVWSADVSAQSNYRPLIFPNNSRTLTFPNNSRTLGFDGPVIRYPTPQYSLDMLRDHPFNSATTRGHASLRPDSPKWFRPGYGYQSPYETYRGLRYRSLNPYTSQYAFGIRQPNQRRSDATHLNWTNAYGGPWYFPGSSTNTRQRSFRW